jgi:integrase
MPKKKAPPGPLPPAPQKRRARGTGTILWDERRRCYRARVPVGRYPDGRTRYREVRDATQAGAVEKMRAAAPPDPDAVTVREWAERWLEGLTNRPSTRAAYAHSINARVVPDLGHVRLRDLKVSQVSAAAQGWAGGKAEGKLAPQTVNLTLDRAATMFAAAVQDRLAAENPFALAPRLGYERKPIDPFAPAELRLLVDARGRLSCGPLFAFLAATGCRVGEAVALDVADYDRATGRVAITKTHSPAHGTGPPKSKHSRRTLALPPQARAVAEGAIGARTTGPLFATAGGLRFNYADLRYRFIRLQALLGLRRRTLHATRHGVATALVAAGVPLGDVARWLGDTVEMIVKTYLHPTGHDVGGALGRVLGGRPGV